MEDFYFYTLAIALVILILMLTMIGITIYYGNGTKEYPPTLNACPDYWVNPTDFSNVTPTANDNNKSSWVTSLPGNTEAINYCLWPGKDGTNKGNSSYNNQHIITDFTNFKEKIKSFYESTDKQAYIQMKGNDASWNAYYPGMTTRCAKRKWAIDNGIVWDGVSNYNGCSETKK
jgi:hypothetical protein